MLTDSASCDEVMPLIAREGVTHVALVPALAQLWVQAREWEDSDLSSLRVIQAGGARLDPALAEQAIATFDCTLQQVFGMAEGLLCFTRLDDPHTTILHSQGAVVPLWMKSASLIKTRTTSRRAKQGNC